MFDKDIYLKRRDLLRRKIKSGIVLMPGNGNSSINYRSNVYNFRQDSTFLYFFGINKPNLVGIIDVDADTACIYGDDFTMDDVIWMGDQPSVKELAASTGIASSYSQRDLYKTINSAISKGQKIHFLPPYRESSSIFIQNLLGINSSMLGKYVSQKLIRAVVSLREIKEHCEIEEMERACETGYNMHTMALSMCREGVTEKKIAGAIEGISLSYGAGLSFHSIVSQHGEILHNVDYDGKLRNGRLLLIDAGAESLMNYCSDFTRTIPVSGKYTQKQRDVYNVVLAAYLKAIELSKPDVKYLDVHLECSMIIAKGLIDIGIMKGNAEDAVSNGAHALFMPHGLGHQIGLDVHDMENLGENFVGYDQEVERSTQFGLAALRMGKKLSKGNVVTVEPGIYFIPKLIEKWESERINNNFINYDVINKEYLDFGGIRLEDNILITDSSCRVMGAKRIPYTPDQIEEFMNLNNK